MRSWPALLLLVAASARADTSQCQVVDVDFTPTDNLQIVAWIERADGTFVDTIYITNKVGRFGLGNRPGRYDFNSGPMWPYGRRVTTFPVWAHRHGLTWPEIVFQSEYEDDISGGTAEESTVEHTPPYCRPMDPHDPSDQPAWDAGTCATPIVFTDKGKFSGDGAQSLYPPRSDLTPACSFGCDSPSVAQYASLNPFDAISQATPLGGLAAEITWPNNLPQGSYVLLVETAKEFDFDGTYNPMTYPSPGGLPFPSYGLPYRGQPSVVYSVPFTVGAGDTLATTQSYAGYGDPEGATGTLHAPDATIDTSTPASGASRLSPIAGATGERLRVCARTAASASVPDVVTDLAITNLDPSSATLQFSAPAITGTTCAGGPVERVAGYEIRYLANTELTVDNFADATPIATPIAPLPTGAPQSVDLTGLMPSTDYWIGVRAFNECHVPSHLAIEHFTTPDRAGGAVDACFIATAAYGSLMANDVEPLRAFRDRVLRTTVLGELAVETYYTFSPPVAGVIGESELLRHTVRDALAPVVRAARAVTSGRR